MNIVSSKLKKVFEDSLHSLSKAYFRQRERELLCSREKWKKKAIKHKSTITALEKELKQTKEELKKIDFQ